MGNFKTFLDEKEVLKEKLTIVKKKWSLKDNTDQGFTVEINDSETHPILDRIKDRTEMKLNDMNAKLQKGVDYVLKKNSKGFFKHKVSYVELTYAESNFKAIFMIKPEQKYLRISSIFEMSYKTDGAFLWNINEFLEQNPEYSDSINENAEFYLLEEGFYNVEINERNNSYDVYISDYNDVIKLEIQE